MGQLGDGVAELVDFVAHFADHLTHGEGFE